MTFQQELLYFFLLGSGFWMAGRLLKAVPILLRVTVRQFRRIAILSRVRRNRHRQIEEFHSESASTVASAG